MLLLDSSRREWWYLAGLIASDGCLIRNGRNVVLVAKDRDFLEMLRSRCGLKNAVREHWNGRGALSHHVNICGREFWRELEGIGLTPAKSKTIGALAVPEPMFRDFLRGMIDGDGSIRRWTHPTNGREQWSLRIYSASRPFLEWLRKRCAASFVVTGGLHHSHSSVWVLKYGKLAAQRILSSCYDEQVPALNRKRRLALACVAAANGWSRSKTVGQVAKLANAADS
jgi:hypothetical protein